MALDNIPMPVWLKMSFEAWKLGSCAYVAPEASLSDQTFQKLLSSSHLFGYYSLFNHAL
jgi:hypothetical protein